MLLIYTLIACVFYLFSFLFILLLSLFKDKYKNSLKARFFLINNPRLDDCDMHFHVCSFGETNAIKPMVLSLSKHYKINITTITQTGYDNAKSFAKSVAFLPFEIFLPFWLSRAKLLVIFEAELWLMLVSVARKKGAKIVLLNARISDKSLPRYQRFGFLYRKIFSYIDEVYAQSEVDKQRLESLGAINVKISGNLKLSAALSSLKSREDNSAQTSAINSAQAVSATSEIHNASKTLAKPAKPLCIIASTHKGEEEPLLDGVLQNKSLQDHAIIIAPRHPERFAAIKALAQTIAAKHGKSISAYSDDASGYLRSDIFVLDVLGRLSEFYAISDVVVLCGSFVDGVGGHNVLEPAVFGAKIISGKYIFNQKELYSYVDGVCFCDMQSIKDVAISSLPSSSIKSQQAKFDINQLIKYMDKS